MVYQEQVMQMAQVSAVIRWAAPICCDVRWVRKKPKRWRNIADFRDGAAKDGLSEAKADEFRFDGKVCGYGFNKSHALLTHCWRITLRI